MAGYPGASGPGSASSDRLGNVDTGLREVHPIPGRDSQTVAEGRCRDQAVLDRHGPALHAEVCEQFGREQPPSLARLAGQDGAQGAEELGRSLDLFFADRDRLDVEPDRELLGTREAKDVTPGL